MPGPGETIGKTLLDVAGQIRDSGSIAEADVKAIAAEFIDSLGLQEVLTESWEETLIALGIEGGADVAAGTVGPWAVLAPFMLAGMLVESLLVLLIMAPAIMLVVLLGAMYAAHDTTIGVGPVSIRLGAVFDPIVGVLETVVKAVGGILAGSLHMAIRSAKWFIYAISTTLGIDTVTRRERAVHAVWAPLSRDTAILRETIAKTVVPALDSTAKDLMNLHEQLHGVNATLYHGPHSLTDQMDGVQHDLTYINNELGRVWHDLSKQAHEIAALQSAGPHAPPSLKPLQQEVERLTHDVQAIPPELATIRQRLTELENRPAGHGGMTELQVHHLNYAHYIAAALAPLLALAPFTVEHLKNLRKLQDDPCQCPTIGGVPNPLIAAIVADLVVTEGL